jgi:hypothetical protein
MIGANRATALRTIRAGLTGLPQGLLDDTLTVDAAKDSILDLGAARVAVVVKVVSFAIKDRFHGSTIKFI